METAPKPTASANTSINVNDLIASEPPTTGKIDVAINLLSSLCDGQQLVNLNPERAAAMMEMAGLLEGTIKEALIDHMTKTEQCYLPFVASPDEPRCLLLLNGGKLSLAY